jgi:hypothetical protein
MDFKEDFTSPFTTPTTCYSASSSLDAQTQSTGSKDTHVHFATETHLLSVHVPSQNPMDQSHQDFQASSRVVPRDSSNLMCVGYSRAQEEKSEELVTILEAMAIVNPNHVDDDSLFEDETLSQLNLLQPALANHTEKDSDGASVVSNADTSSTATVSRTNLQQQQLHHRRVSSTTSALTVSSVAGTSTTPSKSRHQKTTSEISTGSSINSLSDREGPHTNTTTTSSLHSRSVNSIDVLGGPEPSDSSKKEKAEQRLRDAKARLILSQEKRTIHTDATEINSKHLYSLALLEFRPLCPCVASWGIDSPTPVVGVFVGSADDASLRFYCTSTSDPRSLVSWPLPEEHFTVETPVLALDFGVVKWPDIAKTTCTLAMACQDGTIQLVTWESSSSETTQVFHNISSQRFIVDGPLLCIKLDYNIHTSLRVTVGSLCGYVCQLFYSNNGTSSSWEGPFMVAQNLWNSILDEEDCVQAVSTLDNYVAVGTQVGRLILYATEDSERYVPVWHCLLPYSIHGIRILRQSQSDSRMTLAVTTRRSFHLFRAVRGRVAWKHKPSKKQYAANQAGSRLLDILKEIRKKNEQEDHVTEAVVNETIQEILDRVEETVQENPPQDPDAMSVVSHAMEELLDRVEMQINHEISRTQQGSERSFSSRGPQLEYSSSEDDGDVAEEPVTTSGTDQSLGNTSIEPTSSSEVPLQHEENDDMTQCEDGRRREEQSIVDEGFVIVETPRMEEEQDPTT